MPLSFWLGQNTQERHEQGRTSLQGCDPDHGGCLLRCCTVNSLVMSCKGDQLGSCLLGEAVQGEVLLAAGQCRSSLRGAPWNQEENSFPPGGSLQHSALARLNIVPTGKGKMFTRLHYDFLYCIARYERASLAKKQ